MSIRAPGIHEVTVITREDSSIRPLGISKTLNLAILMCHVNLTVVSIQLSSLEINITCFLIHTIDTGYIIVTLLYLTDQLAVHIIEIEMHIAIAVARKQNILLAHDTVLYHFFLHKLRYTFLNQLLALSSERIHGIETHIVLMTVHGVDNQAVGIRRCLDTWIIAICINRNIERNHLTSLQVIAPETHL